MVPKKNPLPDGVHQREPVTTSRFLLIITLNSIKTMDEPLVIMKSGEALWNCYEIEYSEPKIIVWYGCFAFIGIW